jgi:DNA polymerase III delta prime subunit
LPHLLLYGPPGTGKVSLCHCCQYSCQLCSTTCASTNTNPLSISSDIHHCRRG